MAPVVAVAAALAEIAVFVAVAHAVGAGWAVLLLAVSSAVGLMLLRREGVRAWRRFQSAAQAGRPPGEQVSDGLVGLLGALLLAVPGFVTAVVGLLMVLPPTRWVVRRAVQRAAERRVSAAVAGDLFGPRRVRVRQGAPVPSQSPPGGAGVRVDAPIAAGDATVVDGGVVEGEIVPVAPTVER